MPANTRRKIAVCYLSADMVHADFAMCLAGLCMRSAAAGLEIEVVNAKTSIVAEGRNMAVERAREWGADAMLFLDSDMRFSKETLLRLLEHGKDIVGASYCRRVPPHKLLGAIRTDGMPDENPELVEMRHLPTGCMLIDMTVFERLTKPYFRFETDERLGAIRGEDYVFCERAINAGLQVWCDVPLTFVIGHIGQRTYQVGVDTPHKITDLKSFIAASGAQ